MNNTHKSFSQLKTFSPHGSNFDVLVPILLLRMQSLTDFHEGDLVQIVGISELELVLQCYISSDVFSYLCELDLEWIAGQKAIIVSLPDILNVIDWDGFIDLGLCDGQIVHLPMAALADSVDEPAVFVPQAKRELVRIRHHESEVEMIRILAAETIQDFYRYAELFVLVAFIVLSV